MHKINRLQSTKQNKENDRETSESYYKNKQS